LEDSFVSPPVVAAVNSILRSDAFPGLARHGIDEGRFPTARVETEGSIKLNHELSDRNALMLRYAFTNNRQAGNAFNTDGLTDASARGSSFTKDEDFAAALTTIVSPQSVSDLRIQYANRRAVTRTNDDNGPGVEIAGLVDFGRPYGGNGARTEAHDQISWTWSHAASRHLLKAGATFNRVHLDAAIADGFGGLFIFPGLAAFAAGQPAQYRQAFGSIATRFGVANEGGFVQDHWTMTRKLTLDIGARYDFEHLLPVSTKTRTTLVPGLERRIRPIPVR
jgi:outer membrane receptor protein involved in Fe transport